MQAVPLRLVLAELERLKQHLIRTALIPPVAIGLSGAAFYGSAICTHIPSIMSSNAAGMIVAVGASAGVVARVLSKSSKYSLFDPAKEMVYITMDKVGCWAAAFCLCTCTGRSYALRLCAEKTEGKSAVDLLGSYFGKSGASWLTQARAATACVLCEAACCSHVAASTRLALVLVLGTLSRAMPAVAVLHLSACVCWTHYTVKLAKEMQSAEAAPAQRSQDGPAAPAEEPEAPVTMSSAKVPPPPSIAGAAGIAATGQVLMVTTAGAVPIDSTLQTVDEWVMSADAADAAVKSMRLPDDSDPDVKKSLRSYVDTFDEE
eukprot:365607-Chlamydomonas_euryale.AAC.16